MGSRALKRVLVIGASGFIGGQIAQVLLARGIEVLGVSRSRRPRDLLWRSGDLAEPSGFADWILASDAVVNAAKHLPGAPERLREIGRLAGDKPFVHISGTGVIAVASMGEPSDAIYSETAAFEPPPGLEERREAELAVLGLAEAGRRAMVVRPPLVYGHGGSNQIPALAESARRSGAVRYVGRGLNQWGFIHVDDLATLVVSALERGRGGAVYHSVAGEVNFKTLAEAVAEGMQLKAESWSPDEAVAPGAYGRHGARIVMGSASRSSDAMTRSELGWEPERFDILEDVRGGSYQGVW